MRTHLRSDRVGGMLTVEAEHFHESKWTATSGRWDVIDDPWAAGGRAIRDGGWWQRPPIDEEPGSVAYAVELTRAGPHYVWIRGRSRGAPHDAFYLQLDDGPRLPRYVEPDAAGWVWNRGWQQIDVGAPGLHVLRFYRRDPRVEIDKIVVTPWPGYQPRGQGPGESPRR